MSNRFSVFKESQTYLSFQTQINFETYSKEISFFRNVLLEGDFTAAVKCLLPLQ